MRKTMVASAALLAFLSLLGATSLAAGLRLDAGTLNPAQRSVAGGMAQAPERVDERHSAQSLSRKKAPAKRQKGKNRRNKTSDQPPKRS